MTKTPPAGFEPATRRLTVVGSTAELQKIGLFLLKFEIQFIILITHFSKDISVLIKTQFLGVLIRPLQIRNEQENFYWFHVPKEGKRKTRLELATNSLEGCDSTIELLPHKTTITYSDYVVKPLTRLERVT